MKSGPLVRMEAMRPELTDLSTENPSKPPCTQFQTACHADAPHSPPSAKAMKAVVVPKRNRFIQPSGVGPVVACAMANTNEETATPAHAPKRTPNAGNSQPRNNASSADDCTLVARKPNRPTPSPASPRF